MQVEEVSEGKAPAFMPLLEAGPLQVCAEVSRDRDGAPASGATSAGFTLGSLVMGDSGTAHVALKQWKGDIRRT